MGDEVQKILADCGVTMITYARQTTNSFHVLDISLFGIFRLIKGNADERRMIHKPITMS
jgi:hypothetical protein